MKIIVAFAFLVSAGFDQTDSVPVPQTSGPDSENVGHILPAERTQHLLVFLFAMPGPSPGSEVSNLTGFVSDHNEGMLTAPQPGCFILESADCT